MNLFIFAGEKSGDKLGAQLLQRLPQDYQIEGVAGPEMRKHSIKTILPMEAFEVMGFIDILSALPKIYRHFIRLKKHILKTQPDAVIFIDYPGFNLRLAGSLRKAGFQGKLIHYVCPTVWAWGKKRIPLMAKTYDELLTLFPFEEKCFENTSLKVTCVGHPLGSQIKPCDREERYLALFPGSRKKEIERNLPLQLKIGSESGLPLAISIADEGHQALIESLAADYDVTYFTDAYALMKQSALAFATSGTINLELALHNVPTVVTFAITALDLFLATKIFKINLPYYCLVNILTDEEIFPELYGPNFNEDLLREKMNLLLNKKKRLEISRRCEKVRALLGEGEAHVKAANAVQRAIPS